MEAGDSAAFPKHETEAEKQKMKVAPEVQQKAEYVVSVATEQEMRKKGKKKEDGKAGYARELRLRSDRYDINHEKTEEQKGLVSPPHHNNTIRIATSSSTSTASSSITKEKEEEMAEEDSELWPWMKKASNSKFTSFLDYKRYIRPPPPSAFCSKFVRLQHLPYQFQHHHLQQHPLHFASDSRPPSTPPFSTMPSCQDMHRSVATGTAVDVMELPNRYVFVVEVPGLKLKNMKVQVENDSILKISGTRKPNECDISHEILRYINVERQGGHFMRKFNLPTNIALDNISAACHHGLLHITLPKKGHSQRCKPKEFEINVMAMPSKVSML